MEGKSSLNQQIPRGDTERLWLNYFNNTLLKDGLITPDEHRKMQMRIVQRKRGKGR